MNKPEMDTGFTKGKMGNSVIMDTHNMRILSVHTFKPNENYLQTDYYQWVLYIKEQIPKALLPYIEQGEVEIYNSDTQGGPNSGRTVFKVSVDNEGLVDTSREPALTIIGNNTSSQRSTVRTNNNEIFWGTLGQSRNYTISYKVKEGVSLEEFSRVLNDYITEHNERMLFSSWLEADYLDSSDKGAAPKQLTGSYANSYLRTNDTDKDGLFDFVEFEYGTDIRKVDTDGDGVPDGQEILTDKTGAKDAASYKLMVPTTKVVAISPAVTNNIAGALPKPLIDDPSDASKKLSVTNQDAGNVVVKLVAVDQNTGKIDESKTYATTLIPFDQLLNGEFTLSVPKGTIPDTVHTVKIVAYSPDGNEVVEAASTIDVATDASRYTLMDGTITVGKGSTPNELQAKQAITNADDLPKDAFYSWEELPDTSKAGTVFGKVKVTFADGSSKSTHVKVNVSDQAGMFDPTAQDVTVDMGAEPNAADGIAHQDQLPGGITIGWETKPDTSKPGDTTGTIVVTYPDGSKDKVQVPVHVKDTRTDTQKYDPKGQKVTVELNAAAPDAKLGIVEADKLPKGTSFAWKKQPSTAQAGTTKQTVVVTYADKTTDEVEVDFEVQDNRTDAEKYPVTGQDITVNLNEGADAEKGIVNASALPKTTQIEWVTVPNTSRPGDIKGTIEVTFKDQSSTTVEVTIHVIDNRPEKDKFEPLAQKMTVKMGEQVPEAKFGVAFAGGELPQGATYTWKTTPSTAKPGTTKQTITVTYADKSSEDVQIDFEVVDARTDAQKYDAQGQKVATPEGTMPPASEGIANFIELPEDTEYTWKTAPDVSKAGTSKGTILVTYPDKSTEELEVEVTVQALPQNGKFDPRPGSVTVGQGTQPTSEQAKAAIANAAELPADASYEWVKAPDTASAGTKKGTVKVTYSDDTTDTVEVEVKVVEQADLYTPTAQDITVDMGKMPQAADGIANKGELPKNATYEWANEPDTSKPGEATGTIAVTYPDKSRDLVHVTVHVNDTRSDAQKNDPKGQKVTATLNAAAPDAKLGIVDADKLPAGTSFAWKSAPSTAKPGTSKAVVVVTYADKSSDEVEVDFEVVDNRKDAEKYDAKGQTVTVDMGREPSASDGVANKGELPKDVQIAWGTKPDTSKPGKTTGTIVITYKDGSQDMLTVPVQVNDTRSDAEKYTAKGQPVTTQQGLIPPAANAIANMGELPGGTNAAWKEHFSTDTPGKVTATVVVTYPDDSTDEVAVEITVLPKPAAPQSDKYDPKGATVTVGLGGKMPDASEAIANKGEMPKDAVYTWAQTPSTDHAGTFSGKVNVTYSDGTFDVVNVSVNVVDKRSDADKYDAMGQGVTVELGREPNAADAISNRGDLPSNVQISWETKPDTSKVGDTSGVVVVVYPDGSKDKVTVPVHVKDSRSDAEKYNPMGQEVTVEEGKEPSASDGIANKGDLPEGTKIEWGTKPDTSKPGDTTGVIVVTYPDGTMDKIEVPVHVKDASTDADQFDPKGQDVTAETGKEPNASDGIANKGDLPEGTKIEWGTKPDTSKPGTSMGTITVTYPDGSMDTVEVTVTVRDPKPAGDESSKDKGGAGHAGKQDTAKQDGGKGAKAGKAGKGMLPKTGDVASVGIVGALASGLGALGAAFGLKRRRDAER